MENPLDAGSHYCVAGGTSGVVTIFNAKNGHIYASSRIHGDDVRSLALLPAPSIPQKGFSGISKMKSTPGLPLLFTTSYDGSSAMWRLRSNGFTRLGSSSKAGGSGSGSGSGSGGRSGVVTSGTNNHVFERLAVLQGEHSDKVLCGSVVPWTQQLITTGADGRVASWTI
jgi:WD40 repeat protein